MSEYKSKINSYNTPNGKKWRVEYAYKTPDGKYHRSCKRGFDSDDKAKNWEKRELYRVIDEKENQPISTPTFPSVIAMKNRKNKQTINNLLFSELVEIYMKRSEKRKKETTCGTKESIINSKILPHFKDELVIDITVDDIENWQDFILDCTTKQGEPYSPSYIRTIRSQFSAIMNYAVEKLGLPFNPLDRADMIGDKDGKDRAYWTLEQYSKFRNIIAEKPKYFYPFEVLFWTGMRMGEMLALKPNDINFKELTVRVDETYTRFKGRDLITAPKTKSSIRTIHIPQTLADELQEYMNSIYGLKDNDRIFLVTKSGLHREIDKFIESYHIPDICIHGLRHSCASMLLSNLVNAPEIVVSKILGHSSNKTMTGRYSHAYENDLITVAERINKIMEDIDNVSEEFGC